MEIYCKVVNRHLDPLSEGDVENVERIKDGTDVKCVVTQPRNIRFHRKYWALVRLTFENLPERLTQQWNIRSEQDMHKRFKRDLGYFTSTINEYGEREVEYLSISFSAMENQDFAQFYEQCVNLVLYTYIPGMNKYDLEEEIMERFR